MEKISKNTAAHYVWGESCDGWNLVSGQDLSVIHESMPAHTRESKHFHQKARQFFFILKGGNIPIYNRKDLKFHCIVEIEALF